MLKIVINKENRSYKKEMNLKLLHVYCKNNEIHLITAAVRTFFATWPAGSCTVSSSKIVLLLHTMEGPYIDI